MADLLLGIIALLSSFLYLVVAVTVYRVALGRQKIRTKNSPSPSIRLLTWLEGTSLFASVSAVAAGLFVGAALLTHAIGKSGIQTPSELFIAGGAVSFIVGNLATFICFASNHTDAITDKARNAHYCLAQGMRAALWPLAIGLAMLVYFVRWGMRRSVGVSADRLVFVIQGRPRTRSDLERAERIAGKEREVGIFPGED